MFMVENSAATEIGQMLGLLFWGAIGLTVIIKQAGKLNEENRSKFATSGLLLAWAGMILLSIIGVINDRSSEGFTPVSLLFALVWFLLQGISLIFSGVGFIQTFSKKKGRITGRTAAVVAILISAVLFTSVAVSALAELTPETFAEKVEEISIPSLGIHIDLEDSAWIEWDTFEDDCPYAEQGVLYSDKGIIAVVGIWDTKEYDNLKAINEAILSRMGISDSERNDLRIEPSLLDGKIANDLYYTDEADNITYENWVRVCLVDDFAVAVVSWWHKGTDTAAFDRAFESITFDPETARRPNTLSNKQKKAQGQMTNSIGLYHFERSRYTYALNRFKDAFELLPTDPVILENYCLSASNAENYEATIPYIREHIDSHSDSTDLLVKFALLLAESGDLLQATDRLETLFRSGYVNDDNLLSYLNYMIDQDREKDAAILMLEIIETNPKVKYKAWLASVYRIGGMLQEAQATLQAIELNEKTDQLVFEEKVRIKLAQETPTEALEIITQWREYMPDDYDAFTLIADTYLDLKWYVKAQEEIARALTIYEGDSELIDYRNHIQSITGKDDLSLVEASISPVATPEEIIAEIERSSAEAVPGQWSNKLAYYNYRTTGYFFKKGEKARKTYHNKITLLTRSAVENFSTLSFNFDRSAERVYINKVIVRDETGEIIAHADRQQFYVAEQSDSELATDEMTVYVPVNGLSVGSTLEWQVTVGDLGTSDTFAFTRKYLYPGYPAKEQFIYVVGDTQGLLTEPFKIESLPIDTEDTLIWSRPNHAGIQTESSMPDYDQCLPHLEIGSDGESWKEVVNEYLEKIEDYLVPDKSIQSVVEALDIDQSEPKELVYQLARIAQNRVVYKALEFGSRGRIPELASETWENRYGDCKDQTILMLQLLKAFDIESYPLLISTTNDIVRNIPSMDQFNHMVLYVPALEPNPVIDLVDINFDFNYGPPQGLGGTSGIICQKDAARIYTVPQYPYCLKAPVATILCSLDLDASANQITASEKLLLSGYYGKWKRSMFLDMSPDLRHAKIKDQITAYLPPETVFTHTELVNLDDPTAALEIHVRYTFPLDNEASTKFTPTWEAFYLDMTPASERKQPYRFEYPFTMRSEVSTKLDELVITESAQFEMTDASLLHVSTAASRDQDSKKGTLTTHVGWNSITLYPNDYYRFYATIAKARTNGERAIKRNKEGSIKIAAEDDLVTLSE